MNRFGGSYIGVLTHHKLPIFYDVTRPFHMVESKTQALQFVIIGIVNLQKITSDQKLTVVS